LKNAKVQLSPFSNRLFQKSDTYILENNAVLPLIDVTSIKRLVRLDCTAIEPQIFGSSYKQYFRLMQLQLLPEMQHITFQKVDYFPLTTCNLKFINIKLLNAKDCLVETQPSDKTIVALHIRTIK